ncbi:MAG: prepilin-type N-terminal cleavage/methylation domain-containing protein [Acidimicrobiales bacterium]
MSRLRRRCAAAVDERRRRGQGGFTLVEVILTISIGSIVMLPLLAWMVLGFRTQVVVGTASSRTAATNLLGAYLPRDVAAAKVTLGGSDCPSVPAVNVGSPPYGPDRIVFSVAGATTTVKYVLRPEDATVGTLIRRVCVGGGVDDTVIADGVKMTAASPVSATCSARASYSEPASDCGRLDVTVVLNDGRSLDVSASRRVDK